MHGPKLNRDWVGLRVRLRRSATNGYCTLASGTEGVVDHYSRVGIDFIADPCPACQSRLRMGNMRRADFDILTPLEDWPNSEGKGRNHGRRALDC